MIRNTIYYSKYPSSQKATNYSRDMATLQFYIIAICLPISIAAIAWYVAETLAFFKEAHTYNALAYLGSFLGIFVASAAILYCFSLHGIITDNECAMLMINETAENNELFETKLATEIIRREYKKAILSSIKSFYFNFIPGLIGVTGIIGFIESIIIHKSHENEKLILSLSLVIGAIILFVCKFVCKHTMIFQRLRNMIKKPIEFQAQQPKAVKSNNPVIFCRMCGTKIPSDSLYCTKCGNEVKRLS